MREPEPSSTDASADQKWQANGDKRIECTVWHSIVSIRLPKSALQEASVHYGSVGRAARKFIVGERRQVSMQRPEVWQVCREKTSKNTRSLQTTMRLQTHRWHTLPPLSCSLLLWKTLLQYSSDSE